MTKEIKPLLIPYETIQPPGNIVLYHLSRLPAHFYKPYILSRLYPNNVKLQKEFLAWKAQPAIVQDEFNWSLWMCVLGWLYKKKWNPKHKLAEISRYKQERDLLEPFGDLLHSALLLCEQCYLYINKFGYCHHLIWFDAVALELKRFGLSCPQGKEKLVIKLREAAKKLRDNQNPYDLYQYPALWQLIEASFVLANSNLYKGFRNKYLTRIKPRRQRGHIYEIGFISAISSWASQLHTNSELCSIKSTPEKISINSGSGKGVETIPEKKLKKWVCQNDCQIRDCQF